MLYEKLTQFFHQESPKSQTIGETMKGAFQRMNSLQYHRTEVSSEK